jgi:hypothetical protein
VIIEASLPLAGRDGREVGTMMIRCLHSRQQWRGIDALIDLRQGGADPYPAAPVQLLEEMTYAYESTSLAGHQVQSIEPGELFTFTSNAGEGRLEALRATGTLTVAVASSTGRSDTAMSRFGLGN